PLRYSYICGENEEENPWTPFHVDRGFKREDSTVTAFKASNFCNISGGEGVGPEEILRQIATNMPPMYGGGDGVLLLLGVNHAQSLFEAGLTKRDVKQRLWELARLPISHFAEAFSSTERAHGRGDDKTVWRASSPDEIYIAVAGGAGPQNVYIGAGMPQTRSIQSVVLKPSQQRRTFMRLIAGRPVCESIEELTQPDSSALVLVDVQNDYLGAGGLDERRGEFSEARARGIVPNMKMVLERARELGLFIVYLRYSRRA